jgi:hypothetical protein
VRLVQAASWRMPSSRPTIDERKFLGSNQPSGIEDPEPGRDTYAGDDPEADDDGHLAPSQVFEVMVDGSNPERCAVPSTLIGWPKPCRVNHPIAIRVPSSEQTTASAPLRSIARMKFSPPGCSYRLRA